ncbi:Uncharacterised protein [Mycobacterium tuberculosis]|nr:Uncharacterised protein [Mycobacterium tuberculosis]
MPGTFLLVAPCPPVLPVTRRPVGTSAVLGPFRAASLEGPIPVSRTSFTPAFEPPPTRTGLITPATIVTITEPTLLRTPFEPAPTLTVVAALEPPPTRTALITPGTVVTVTEPTLLRTPFEPAPTLTVVAALEPPPTRTALITPGTLVTVTEPTLLRTPFKPAPTLTSAGTPLTPWAGALTGPGGAAGAPFPALVTLTAELPFPGLAAPVARAIEPPPARLARPASLTLVSPLARSALATALAAEPPFAGPALTGPRPPGPPIRGPVPTIARTLEAAFTAVTARAAETTVATVVGTTPTGVGTPIIRGLERTAGLAVIALAARIPVLPATACGAAAPALRSAGAGRTATRSAALTTAGAAPTTRRRVPPPVIAPPLAAVVAPAVLFRAHHVRHCS